MANGNLGIGDTSIAWLLDAKSVTSSTARVKVNGLTLPVQENGLYLAKAWLPFLLAGDVSGIKIGFGTPGTIFGTFRKAIQDSVDKVTAADLHTNETTVVEAVIDGGYHLAEMEGLIQFSANGPFYVDFAQSVSNASAASLLPGAYLQLTRVG